MSEIAKADFFRFGIVFRVVVPVGKSQSTLIEFSDLLFGIVRILDRAVPEKNRSPINQMKMRYERGHFSDRLQFSDRRKIASNRGKTPLFDGCFIHARRIE